MYLEDRLRLEFSSRGGGECGILDAGSGIIRYWWEPNHQSGGGWAIKNPGKTKEEERANNTRDPEANGGVC